MIKVSLWENAYDSIEHGLKHLDDAVKTDNPYDYKRAVLDFFHAAELLLKEILYRVNPIYAFDKNDLFKKCKDPLNPTLDELYNCKSLEVNPLCDAIKKYVPEFKANLKIYSEKASRLRNKIQHFCYETNNEEVRTLLLRMSYQLLCPAFTYLNINKDYEPLQKRLTEIFSLDEIIDQHKEIIGKDKNDNSDIGVCFACGSYGLFIHFDGKTGYADHVNCVACGYCKSDIDINDYHECTECYANSLVFCEELDGGICTNYRCANHKDGGILTRMEWCNVCHEYKVEDDCKCNESDEDEEY